MQDSSNATHEEVRNDDLQSNRFERAWTLLAHTYKAEVTTLDNVVPIRNDVSMRVTPNEKGLIFTGGQLRAHYRWYVTDCF